MWVSTGKPHATRAESWTPHAGSAHQAGHLRGGLPNNFNKQHIEPAGALQQEEHGPGCKANGDATQHLYGSFSRRRWLPKSIGLRI